MEYASSATSLRSSPDDVVMLDATTSEPGAVRRTVEGGVDLTTESPRRRMDGTTPPNVRHPTGLSNTDVRTSAGIPAAMNESGI